jgi:serine protease inhibitor
MEFSKKFQCLNLINEYFKFKTENNLQTDIIQVRDLNEEMSGMILDVSYFKVNCIDSFSLLEKKCPFTTQRGEEVLIDMYNKLDLFKIYTNPKGLSGTVCQIPFKGCQIVMSIILPNRNTPISTIVSEISERKVNTFRNLINETGTYRMVNVTLPKIRMESESIEV